MAAVSRRSAIVDWLEPPERDTGVDHLGMRVAGEKAYNRLIDFTTTVTWRARYFSFLCWCLREAWRLQSASAQRDTGGLVGIDANAWRDLIKRWDYVMAASTLVNRPKAERVGGQKTITPRLNDTSDGSIEFGTDHLETRNGSLDIYVGVLRLFDLARNPGGLDRVSPAGGEALAEAFATSLAASGKSDLLMGSSGASIDDLSALGEFCGIDQLAAAGLAYAEVGAEQELLRRTILDWSSFGAGCGKSARRILTIGLVLEIHRLVPAGATLEDFRSFVLLGRTIGSGGVRLELPSIYDGVRAEWRAYQAHAYATFALEVFLEVFLESACDAQAGQHGVPVTTVISQLLTDLLDDSAKVGTADRWWHRALEDVVGMVRELQTAEDDPSAEPTLVALLRERRKRRGA